MTFTQHLHSVAGEDHSLIEAAFIVEMFVIGVDLCQIGLCIVLDALKALFQQHFKTGGMVAGAAGALKIEKHCAAFQDHGHQVCGQVGGKIFIQGLAFPIGENLLAQQALIFFGHLVGILGARGHGVQFVADPAPADLRAEHHRTGGAAQSAHDQLVGIDGDGFGAVIMVEGLGPAQDGVLRFRLPVNLGVGQGPLGVQRGNKVPILVAQTVDAFCGAQGPCGMADVAFFGIALASRCADGAHETYLLGEIFLAFLQNTQYTILKLRYHMEEIHTSTQIFCT